MSSKRTPVKLPDFLQPDGTLPHTGAAVPDPTATLQPAKPARRRPAARRASPTPATPAPSNPKMGEPVAAIDSAAAAALSSGRITRVDVQVPAGISTWLRDSTRPEHTALTRSLGARTPASSLLTAAVELLAERGMDLSKLDSSDPAAVTAAFRAALEQATKQ